MFSRDIFSERIRQLRLSKNLKQSNIAELLGVTVTQISDIERGRRTTTVENLVSLADYFDVSIDYITGRSDNPKSHKN